MNPAEGGEAMRPVCIGAVVLFALSLQLGAEEAADDFYLIQAHRVADLEVGMSVDDLYSVYDWYSTNLVDLFFEGDFSPAIEIYLNDEPGGEPSLVAEVACKEGWIISAIWVYDERFALQEDVGVGSTLGGVRARCGKPSVYLLEGRVLASVSGINPVFELDVDQATVARWQEEDDPGVIPDTAPVVSVLVR
jgi:hypothetical protein